MLGPGLCCLRGNELADRTAKKALSGDVEPCPIPHTDVRPKIKRLVTKKWQEEWDEYPTNKLHHICPSVSETIQATPEKRKDQVVLTRCKIGHTRLTHAFLMQGEDAPECIPCQCPLTVKHILVECIDLREIRERFYHASDLSELFNTVKAEVILNFLKAAGLYNRI